MTDRSQITPDAESFLREWQSAGDYITAHTSGSTGLPKSIKLLKEDMRISSYLTCDFFGIDESSLLFSAVSPRYIGGKMQIVRAVERKCELICIEPSTHFEYVPPGRTIDLASIVPAQIEAAIQLSRTLPIRNLIIGGAPLTQLQETELVEAGINAYATYGMTETCSHVALRKIGQPSYLPLPGFEFKTDADQCLVISQTPMSMSSLHTSDVVSLSADGSFVWKGRRDNIINTGGIKVQAEEIEQRMLPFMGIRKYYVTSRPHPKWGSAVTAVVEGDEIPGLLMLLRQHLPHIMCPKNIEWVNEIMCTPTMKMLRR